MAGCDGPSGEAWSAPHNACVGTSSQTSCDSVSQTTCRYAFMLDSGDKASYFSGKFARSVGLKIEEPGLLVNLGMSAGSIINMINGLPLVDEVILQGILDTFTPDSPATIYTATHLLGRFQLTLVH